MDGDIFENAPHVDADIFYTDRKDAFSNISGYVWMRPESALFLQLFSKLQLLGW